MQLASAQAEIDNAEPNGLVALEERDYGPILIKKPLTLACEGACFWTDGRAPSVRIHASNVCIQNATLRSLGLASDRVLPVVLEVAAKAFATFQAVKLCGAVEGLAGESDLWILPRFLNLGDLKSAESYFIVELAVPVSCQLISRVAGIDFDPPAMVPGINKVKMRVRDISQDSLLVGNVELITSQLTRLIPLYGRVSRFSAANVNNVATLFELTKQEEKTFLASRLPPPEPKAIPATPRVKPAAKTPPPEEIPVATKAGGTKATAKPSLPKQPVVTEPQAPVEKATSKQTPWAPPGDNKAEVFRPQPQQVLSSLFEGFPTELKEPEIPSSEPPKTGGLFGTLFAGGDEAKAEELPEVPKAKPEVPDKKKNEDKATAAPIISSLFTREED